MVTKKYPRDFAGGLSKNEALSSGFLSSKTPIAKGRGKGRGSLFVSLGVFLLGFLLVVLSVFALSPGAFPLSPLSRAWAEEEASDKQVTQPEEMPVEIPADDKAVSESTDATKPQATEEQLSANTLVIERAYATMPQVDVFAHLDNNAAFSAEQLTAYLGGEALKVTGVEDARAVGEGCAYYVLVDVSGSITFSQMDAVKGALVAFYDSLGANDRLILYSFGEQVNLLLEGSEAAELAHERINGLEANQNFTLLYKGIDDAVAHSQVVREGFPRRAAALVISDGVNTADLGEGHTLNEALTRLGEGSLPLYALGFENSFSYNSNDLENFGELARGSGGFFLSVTPDTFAQKFTEVKAYIESGKVLRLQSATNFASGKQEELLLEATFGEKSLEAKPYLVSLTDHLPDTQSPSVLSVEQSEERRITLSFSEGVLGADSSDAYLLKDKDGAVLALESVEYSESDGSFTCALSLSEVPYEGSYTLECIGITDNSMEANVLSGTFDFELSGTAGFVKPLKTVFLDFWWIILIVVLTLTALIVYRVIRKRKGLIKVEGQIGFGDVAEYRHHFKTPDVKPICLIVTDMLGTATRVELDVSSSVFVGRSKTNNLSFDDSKMSRQHFVIEAVENEFFVNDLNTTNGTFLNGVQLTSRRKLQEGDVITAGHEKFVFRNLYAQEMR